MPFSGIKARDLDITNESHLRSIILEIESQQNIERKQNAWKTDQIANDNQREYVKEELKRLYPKSYNNFRIGDINIVNKIDGKVSKAYKRQPMRKCATDKETERLHEFYEENGFLKTFKEADSIFNIHKYVCLWLTYQNPDPSKGIFEFRHILHALKPYEYDLIRDQVTGEPIIFIQNYPDNEVTRQAGNSDGIEQTISESKSDTSANSRVYSFWSRDKYVTVIVSRSEGHGNKEKMKLKITEVKDNVLGVVPVAYLQKDSSVDYPVKEALGIKSVEWNVAFSDLKTAAATQGHGQLVLSQVEGAEKKELHMGMHTAITLTQSKKPNMPESKANYINPNPNLTGQLEVLKFDVINILDDYGIKAKGAIQGSVEQFSSGFDRLLSEADVQDKVEDNQELYQDTIEQGTFKLVKAAEAAMKQNPFPQTERIDVAFEKPKVLISDKETLENIEKREELGTILPYEKHMILNPNLTEAEAIEREEKIQQYKREKMLENKKLLGLDEEDEVEDEEDDNVE